MSFNAPPPAYGPNPHDPPPPGAYPPPPYPPPFPPPPHVAPPSQTMAIVALAMCCAFIIPLAAIVGIGLAIAVLVKSGPGRNYGTGKAIAGLAIGVCGLLLMLGLVAGLSSMSTGDNVARDEDGAATSSGTVMTTALRVGDCFNNKSEISEDETVEVGTVGLVPCAESHDWETYHGFGLDDGPWPGDSEVARLAEGGCVEAFPAFAGESYEESTLEVFYFLPTRLSWSDGDRKVLCTVGTGIPVTGSLRSLS